MKDSRKKKGRKIERTGRADLYYILKEEGKCRREGKTGRKNKKRAEGFKIELSSLRQSQKRWEVG